MYIQYNIEGRLVFGKVAVHETIEGTSVSA